MFRLLYLLFRKQFNRVIYSQQSKPGGFEELTMAFTDSDGRRYYRYNDDMDMPIKRWAKLKVFLAELTNCIDAKELTRIVDAMDKALNADKRDLAMIGFLIKEIRNRQEMLVHEEILFKIVTALYIREDEKTDKWDEDIFEQKMNQFRKDSREGLYDFFYKAGISKYVPYWEKCKGNVETLLEMSNLKVMALKRILGAYSSGEQSLNSLTKADTSL